MKTKIIFDYQLNGHNIEYLHHLYIGAAKDSANQYIISVPEQFEEIKGILSWPDASNIQFDLYKLITVRSAKPIVTAYKSSLYLRRLVKQYRADEVLLVWMMAVLPFVSILLPKQVKVSGIVYDIYLYLWKEYGMASKIANVLKYWVLVHSKCINKVFILNDNSAVCTLNRRWKTNKFRYLPDPFVPFSKEQIKDLRHELNISENKIIVLHLGAMSFKKGTLTILDMIENSSKNDLDAYSFVFAGKIYPDIKEEFYRRLSILKEKAQIIVRDGFLPYEELGSLAFTCDKVLLPYTRINLSSGSIAYASQFGKTVYAPNKGLLGKLVKRYGIGITIRDFCDVTILNRQNKRLNTYCKSHSVEDFNKVLLDIF